MNKFRYLIIESLKKESGIWFIEEQIRLFFYSIKRSNDFTETNYIFDVLEDLQFELAKAAFKDNIKMTPFLDNFIREFDRVDNLELRLFLYMKIKHSTDTNFQFLKSDCNK